MMNVAAAMPPNVDQPRIVDNAAPESERRYALFNHIVPGIIHISTASTFFPFSVIVALVMWLARRTDSPFLDDHGREATNFRISMILYSLLLVPVSELLFHSSAPACFPVMVLSIYGVVHGAMAAHRGEFYRYPMCIRFIKCGQRVAA